MGKCDLDWPVPQAPKKKPEKIPGVTEFVDYSKKERRPQQSVPAVNQGGSNYYRSKPTTQDVLGKLKGYPRKLNWGDFPEATKGKWSAQTSTDWNSVLPTIALDRGVFCFEPRSVQVSVTLNAGKMWLVKGKGTTELLAHEQGHFDIVGLTARDVCRDLLSLELAIPGSRRGQRRHRLGVGPCVCAENANTL